MKLVAMSRKFPPTYKRRWYICKSKTGKFVVRFNGITWDPSMRWFSNLNYALDAVITYE